MGAVELINGWISDHATDWAADWPHWIMPVLAAPFVGSFAGVLIARLPEGRGFVRGRSACPACSHVLGVRDLVPVASFALRRGRCRFCAAPIPPFHLGVELAALGVALWASAAGERDGLLWAGCALGWTLLALSWIDLRCLRLPDGLTLPLILAGLVEAAWLEPDALVRRAFGAALGYTAFRALALAYRWLRGRDGLGQGDAKLLAAAGAWVGAALLPQVVLAAALSALAWAWRSGRPDFQARVPFGPFLAAGTWLVWLYA